MDFSKIHKKIIEPDTDDELDEDGDGAGGCDAGNTSDATPGYLTPNAFGNKSSCKCKGKSCKCENEIKEASYKEYKSDDAYKSDKDRMNKTIKLLYSWMCGLEKKLKHTSKLKHETGMDDTSLLKSSKDKLIKLREKTNTVISLIDSIYNETER